MTEKQIDMAALEVLLDAVGDREFLSELLDEFYTDSQNLLSAMETALAERDAESLRRAAHSLKSNSGNFGAGAMYEQCRALEEQSKMGDFAGADEKIQAIRATYQLVEAELKAYQEG